MVPSSGATRRRQAARSEPRRHGGAERRSRRPRRKRALPETGPAAAPVEARATEKQNGPPKMDGPFVQSIRRRPTLPGPSKPSTIGAEGLNFSVRNGKRCLPLAMTTEMVRDRGALGRSLKTASWPHSRCERESKYPSSPRPISTGLLRALLRFQIRPINLVVYQGSYSLKEMGELISRSASRLDAFSGYPIRT